MTETISKKTIDDTELFRTPIKIKIDQDISHEVCTKRKTGQQATETFYQNTIKKLEEKIQTLSEQLLKNKQQYEKRIVNLTKEKIALQLTIIRLTQKENTKQKNGKSPKIKSVYGLQLIEIDNKIQLEFLENNLTQVNKQVDERRQQISKLRRDNTQLMKMIREQRSEIDKLKLQNTNLLKTVNFLNKQAQNLQNESLTTRKRSHSSSHKQPTHIKRKNQHHKGDLKNEMKNLETELLRTKNKNKILSETIQLLNQQIVKKKITDLNKKYRNTY